MSLQETGRQLVQLSKDYDLRDVTATEFLINNKKLGFLISDGGGTVRVFDYDANHRESWAGRRLLTKGAMHTGNFQTHWLLLSHSLALELNALCLNR